MSAILEINGLSKFFRDPWTYRRFRVLDRLELSVEEGEIFGLIGPNGAGKTTTFKLLLGLLRPSEGTILFAGRPLNAAARAAIGFLPEQPYFHDALTVTETLDFYARLYGLPATVRRQRVEETIERVRLAHKRHAPLRVLSKGTLQRVGIGQVILNRPRLLILDEPMSGLDPAGRYHMRDLIMTLRTEGSTVIFSSHILPDAEVLCDRVGILAEGQLREIVDLRHAKQPAAYSLTVSQVDAATLAALGRLAETEPAADGNSWSVRLPAESAIGPALDAVRQVGGLVEKLTRVHPSLEERFLAHIEHDLPLD